jgi:hypothetical protein
MRHLATSAALKSRCAAPSSNRKGRCSWQLRGLGPRSNSFLCKRLTGFSGTTWSGFHNTMQAGEHDAYRRLEDSVAAAPTRDVTVTGPLTQAESEYELEVRRFSE